MLQPNCTIEVSQPKPSTGNWGNQVAANPGPARGQAIDGLNLPSLEGGRVASEVIGKYMEGTNTRIAKLSDVKTKIENIPSADRTENISKSSP